VGTTSGFRTYTGSARGSPVSLALDVFAGEMPMARIGYDPLADAWSLAYAPHWLDDPAAFPLSPSLPLQAPARCDDSRSAYDSRSIKRFIEHLLPEGHALDVAIAANGLARSNVFGLIRALGSETAGVLRFQDAQAALAPVPAGHEMREIRIPELDARIADRDMPFTVWDGKVRMSSTADDCSWWKGHAWRRPIFSSPTSATRHCPISQSTSTSA
jgi:serine/threonine-protein kinase HipA